MRPRKRSVTLAGHRTSYSIEAEFREALLAIAAARGQPASRLVAEIDRRRGERGLSSAIRVYVLEYYRKLSGA